MYLMLGTQPDLTYAVSKATQFLTNCSEEHLWAVEHITEYLNSHQDLYIIYTKFSDSSQIHPEGYVDANFAGDTLDQKSTARYTFLITG